MAILPSEIPKDHVPVIVVEGDGVPHTVARAPGLPGGGGRPPGGEIFFAQKPLPAEALYQRVSELISRVRVEG